MREVLGPRAFATYRGMIASGPTEPGPRPGPLTIRPHKGLRMAYLITDSLLEDHFKCNTKSYLRIQGKPGEAGNYSTLCSRLDAHHLASASQWLATRSTACGVSRFGGAPLQDIMTTDEIVLDVVGEAEGLKTHFHALQRTPGCSELGLYCYRPIRFCRQQQPSSTNYLLLAFDASILGHRQGVPPEEGILYCGPTFRQVRARLRTHLDSLAAILLAIRAQSANAREPPLVLNRHCEICEFKQFCRTKAVEEDNLSLLNGITPKEIIRHNSKGIFSVKQLSYTFRPRRPAKRQKQQFHHNFSLQALALREKKVHVNGDPTLTLPQTQVYLDIEGLPDRGSYYLIGALVVTGQFHQHHCFWADDGSGQVTIFSQLATLLIENVDWRVFHYGNYKRSDE